MGDRTERDGDRMAGDFAEFYGEHCDRVLRAVYVCTRDRQLADDAVSEAFARALSRWSTVRRHPEPVAWVTRTAINVARSSWRRRVGTRPGDVPEGSYAVDEPIDPMLVSAVLSLPERQRQVVGLRVLLDLSTEQTAQILRIAPGTVTAHLHRALSSLRSELVEEVTNDEDRG
jgi:RNA polymerase sigma factor (sigma-70 family)